MLFQSKKNLNVGPSRLSSAGEPENEMLDYGPAGRKPLLRCMPPSFATGINCSVGGKKLMAAHLCVAAN